MSITRSTQKKKILKPFRKLLGQKSEEVAIKPFDENKMIVNLNKFWAMVIGAGQEIQSEYILSNNIEKIKIQSSVILVYLGHGTPFKIPFFSLIYFYENTYFRQNFGTTALVKIQFWKIQSNS